MIVTQYKHNLVKDMIHNDFHNSIFKLTPTENVTIFP